MGAHQRQEAKVKKMVWLLCFLMVITISGFSQNIFAQNTDDLKSDIYSKLKCCACEISFDKCVCPEAKEIKAYVDALIETGLTKDEIFYRVAKKFSLNVILDRQIKGNVEKKLINEAGGKRPQIILEPTYFDFGQVSKKQNRISKIFKLSNQGSQPLVITNIKTSCPCASVSLKVDKNKSRFFSTEGSPKDWQMEIKSGQNGELELVVDLASPHVKTGKLIRDALLTSNDPIYPEVTVRIEAYVTE